MRPPSSVSSSRCRPPAPPTCRSISLNPKARVRNAAASLPSSYSKYGVTVCAIFRRLLGHGGSVLEKCFGRTTGEGPKLRDEVWLVCEPARERELPPTDASSEATRALEPQEPRHCLRGSPTCSR